MEPRFAARDSALELLRASPAYVKPVKRDLGKNVKTGEQFHLPSTSFQLPRLCFTFSSGFTFNFAEDPIR